MIITNISDIKKYPSEKIKVLDSHDDNEISRMMIEMKNSKFEDNKLNYTFDYRNYERGTAEWLNSVIGGGE